MGAEVEPDDFAEFKKIQDLIANNDETEYQEFPPAMLISNSYLNPKVKAKKAEPLWRNCK